MIIRVYYRKPFNDRPAWYYLGPGYRLYGGPTGRRHAKDFTEIEARAVADTLFLDNPLMLAWRIEDVDGAAIDKLTREEWESE